MTHKHDHEPAAPSAPLVPLHLAAVRSPVQRYLIGQFMKLHGVLGWTAGWIMARRGSNQQRNLWTVDGMKLEPSHRVLEIGHGPGFALAHVLNRLGDGSAVALDHSQTMHGMARARNRAAVASCKLLLRLGAVADLEQSADPALQGPFDRIYAVNAVMVWHDPVRVHRYCGSACVPAAASTSPTSRGRASAPTRRRWRPPSASLRSCEKPVTTTCGSKLWRHSLQWRCASSAPGPEHLETFSAERLHRHSSPSPASATSAALPPNAAVLTERARSVA